MRRFSVNPENQHCLTIQKLVSACNELVLNNRTPLVLVPEEIDFDKSSEKIVRSCSSMGSQFLAVPQPPSKSSSLSSLDQLRHKPLAATSDGGNKRFLSVWCKNCVLV